MFYYCIYILNIMKYFDAISRTLRIFRAFARSTRFPTTLPEPTSFMINEIAGKSEREREGERKRYRRDVFDFNERHDRRPENTGACLKSECSRKGVNAERGNSSVNFLNESRASGVNRRERERERESVRDRDPRDFTVHRSSYKAASTPPGFFQRANEPNDSAREKKKEQLCSHREMARLKWRRARTTTRRENDFISVCMIIAPLQLQSPVNCVLLEGPYYS